MKVVYIEVAATLIDIEAALRQLKLWEQESPAPEALASTLPFAVDTLTLPQWLQFIFLPRIYALLEAGEPLPGKCAISPIAEEFFRGSCLPADSLLDALEKIDAQLSGDVPEPQ